MTGDGRTPDHGTPSARGETDARDAARGVLSLGVLQLAGRSLAMLFVVVATRSLSPTEYGRYAIVSALLLAGGWWSDFGTTSVITTLVSRDQVRSQSLLSGTLLVSAGMGVLGYAGVVLFAQLANYPRHVVVDIAVAGLGLPLDACLTSVLGAFDGRGLITRRSVLSFLRVALVTGGGLLAIGVAHSVRLAMVSLALGPILTFGVAVLAARARHVWNGRLRFDAAAARTLLRRAVPFALLGGINIVILRLDVLLLSLTSTQADVATYEVALRVVEALTFLAAVIAAPALYILSGRLGRGDVDGAQRAFSEATRLAFLLGIPLSMLLVLLHKPIVTTLFGRDYQDAGVLLAILGSQLWLAFLAAIQGSLLLSNENLGRTVQVFLAVGLIALVIDVTAILSAGSLGAAVAMVIIQFVVVGTAAGFSRRTIGVRLSGPSVGCVASAAAATALAALVFPWAGMWPAIAAFTITYPMALVTTGAVAMHDLTKFRSYFSR